MEDDIVCEKEGQQLNRQPTQESFIGSKFQIGYIKMLEHKRHQAGGMREP